MDADVIILGAGPAGSASAGLLSKQGFRTLVLEQETFPRFKIGESLLPAELPIFEALGYDPTLLPAAYKAGADFLNERTGEHGRFNFCDALPGTRKHAYQVDRAAFDKHLAEHCATLGVTYRFATRVDSFQTDEAGATVTLANGEILKSRFVLDATGRDRLASKQHRTFERIDGLGVAAVWAHFDDLSDAAHQELMIEGQGNITVLLLDQGWGWVIPLTGRRLSVGFVSAKRGVVSHEWWEQEFAASPKLQRITAGARRTHIQTVGDYSFKNTLPAGLRFGCVGDSRAFLDPVFSSGVAFAMDCARHTVEILAPALKTGSEATPDLLAPVADKMERAYRVFGALIHSFYHTGLAKNLFFYPDPEPDIRAGFISILAGDVWREDNRFQTMLLSSARRQPRKIGAQETGV